MGSSIVLNKMEQVANRFLMKIKLEELQQGFDEPTKFIPARSFLEAVEDMKKSKVFRLLKALPKGAVLHGHDSALISSEFLFKMTYAKNLWVKVNDKNEFQEFKFAKEKPGIDGNDKCQSCQWNNLVQLRDTNTSTKVDEWLKPQMSLNSQHAGMDVNTIWKRFMLQFKVVSPLVTYKPAWWYILYNTFKEFYEDNVSYMEIRGRFKELRDLNSRTMESLQVARFNRAVLKSFQKRHRDFYGARFIYSPLRFLNETTFEPHSVLLRKLLRHYPDFVAGFDLVGQEDIGSTLKNLTRSILKEKGRTKFYFHAGETNWSGFHSDENLVDALLLGAKRIGHGYAVTKHPKVAEYIKRKRIGIELCPISNQVLGLVKDMRNHPAAAMFTDDYPIVIAPDDPGFWGAKGVTYDWYEAFMGLAARWQDLRLLKQLALNSIEQTSLNRKQKYELWRLWNKKWNRFIHDVIRYKGIFPEEKKPKKNAIPKYVKALGE
ncbi:adenosine deaminase 2-like [Ctenocephalides felis]|nr:adenosine deaminase 2-like [Ctenocephalides felis]XP_026462407.1 adenosine deaminase 2-like [Ctenocephalides felis]